MHRLYLLLLPGQGLPFILRPFKNPPCSLSLSQCPPLFNDMMVRADEDFKIGLGGTVKADNLMLITSPGG